jgi:tetratricopeptide (TPR) repeat protein
LYLKKLENALILSKQGETLWFRHDLIRFCIEGFLNSNEKKYYHSEADKFFEKKIGLLDKTSELKFQTLTACAYHSHHAQNSDSSLFYNRALFYLSFAWGMFDYSETSALLGIAAAKSLGNTKDEIKFRTGLSRVYHTWGRIEDALSILRENLNQSQRIGDFEEQSIITQDIAIIEERRGNYNEAIRLFETCIEIEKTHKKQTSASVIYHLAII